MATVFTTTLCIALESHDGTDRFILFSNAFFLCSSSSFRGRWRAFSPQTTEIRQVCSQRSIRIGQLHDCICSEWIRFLSGNATLCPRHGSRCFSSVSRSLNRRKDNRQISAPQQMGDSSCPFSSSDIWHILESLPMYNDELFRQQDWQVCCFEHLIRRFSISKPGLPSVSTSPPKWIWKTAAQSC